MSSLINLRKTRRSRLPSYTQRPWGFGDFEVRYTGDFSAVAAAVQQTIHSIDRNLPITLK